MILGESGGKLCRLLDVRTVLTEVSEALVWARHPGCDR
jgi:hypothetical protein